MADILDVLHARWAEASGEAILAGQEHPSLTLTTREVAHLIEHIGELRRAAVEAAAAFERIRTALEQRTAHPEAQARQAQTIARRAAEHLIAASSDIEGTTR